MRYESIVFELEENGLGILTLNEPETLNAHSKKMRKELLAFWRERQNDDGCRVVIMTGAGTSFCSGSDVREMDDEFRPFYKQNASEVYIFQDQISEVILMMRRAPQPIIGAIRGYAVGGGFSFSMATDIRIADATAKFGAAYINVGLSAADMGSSFYLPREVNLGFAAEYLYTGELIGAEEALRIGFVNYIVPPEELIPKAKALAEKMLRKSVLGLRMTKEAINQNIASASLDAALHLENRNQVICLTSAPIKNPLNRKAKSRKGQLGEGQGRVTKKKQT
jgi:enoyl-CoA hydratase